jgi:hypothetical protein
MAGPFEAFERIEHDAQQDQPGVHFFVGGMTVPEAATSMLLARAVDRWFATIPRPPNKTMRTSAM